MPVTVIALVSIDENEPMALARYLEVTTPLLERAGARITKRFVVNEIVVGNRGKKTVIIVEYPSRDAVDSVFLSPEYKKLIPTRDRAFTNYEVSIVDQN